MSAFKLGSQTQRQKPVLQKSSGFVEGAGKSKDESAYPWNFANDSRNTETLIMKLTEKEKAIIAYVSEKTNISMNRLVKEIAVKYLLEEAIRLHDHTAGG